MKAILEIGKTDLNMHLIEVITSLFKQNVTEVVIRKSELVPEEFDKTLDLENVMQSLKSAGHNDILLSEIEQGLLHSSVYAK
jgi:hypothetical protein